MNEHDELDVLSSVWRTEVAAPTLDLEGLVRSEGRRIVLVAVGEVLVSAVFLGGSLWLAIAQPVPEFIVLAIGIWIVTLVSLMWSWTNRAGTLAAASGDTRGFLELSVRRAKAGLASVRYGFYLLLVQVVMLGAWHTWYWSRHQPGPSLEDWLVAALVPAVFLAVLLVMMRRWRRKLERLEALERQLIG